MGKPQPVDVVTAMRRGNSIVLTLPLPAREALGIRKGDRLAVYLTDEGILYVPVRPRSGRARPDQEVNV